MDFNEILLGFLTISFLAWAGVVWSATQRVKDLQVTHATALARIEVRIEAILDRLKHLEDDLKTLEKLK